MPMNKRRYVAPVSKRLTFRQVKQVQKLIERNKELNRSWTVLTQGFNDITNSIVFGNHDTNGRLSNQINVVGLHIELLARNIVTDTTTGDIPCVRVIIGRTKGTGVTSLDSAESIATMPDPDDFQIYVDKILSPTAMAVAGTATDNVLMQSFKFSYKKSFKNKKIPHLNVLYDENDADPNIVRKNQLFIAILADNTALPDPDEGSLATLSVNGFASLKYYDKN